MIDVLWSYSEAQFFLLGSETITEGRRAEKEKAESLYLYGVSCDVRPCIPGVSCWVPLLLKIFHSLNIIKPRKFVEWERLYTHFPEHLGLSKDLSRSSLQLNRKLWEENDTGGGILPHTWQHLLPEGKLWGQGWFLFGLIKTFEVFKDVSCKFM